MTAVLVRYIWPLSAELLAPFTTLPGFRQTDWKMWTMTPCVLDQLERVLLRDNVNINIKANYRIISNLNQKVFVCLAIVIVFYCIAKIHTKHQPRKQVKMLLIYFIYWVPTKILTIHVLSQHDKTIHDKQYMTNNTWQNNTWQNNTWQTIHDKTIHDKTIHDKQYMTKRM